MQIILADHHPQAIWALKTIIREKTKFEIIGDATAADDLLALVVKNPPDLVLMDWELPGMRVENLITALHKIQPKPKVIVMGSNPEQGRLLMRAGADAFISKSNPPDWMVSTLQKFEDHEQSVVR